MKVTLAGFSEQVMVTDAELAQVRLTVPVKPLSSVTVTVEVPACPARPMMRPRSVESKILAGVVAVHAAMRLATSSDPRPVT